MLMFDNVIFSSFVPQILMFVGYVMCMFTGTQHALETNRDVHFEQTNIEYVYQPTETALNTVSFDSYYTQTAEVVDNNVIISIPETGIFTFFSDLHLAVFKGNVYERFSRPPPFC